MNGNSNFEANVAAIPLSSTTSGIQNPRLNQRLTCFHMSEDSDPAVGNAGKTLDLIAN